MFHFNTQELCMIALLLDEDDDEEILVRKRKRRIGVHKMLKNRKTEGEFWILHKELMDDESKHQEYFGMNKVQFEYILNKITPLVKKCDTTFKEAIKPREKLAVCIRYLVTGESFRNLAHNFRLGDSTVKYIIMDVCDAIILTMKNEYIPIPSAQHLEKIAQEFWEMWNFPNCIGAIGGKLVEINKTCSVVLLALVDATHRFIAVDVSKYGTDGIFQNSNLGKSLSNDKFCLPKCKPFPGMQTLMPHVIIGDDAFPLKPYLMRPYPVTTPRDTLKQHFNNRLSRVRSVVETTFRILSHRFPIFEKRIQLKPDFVDKVIFTTCILHNYIGVKSGHLEIEMQSEKQNKGKKGRKAGLPKQGGNSTVLALQIRDTFKNFFQTTAGKAD